MINRDDELRIKIKNKELFYGRPCTEKEKETEKADIIFNAYLKNKMKSEIHHRIAKEQMIQIIHQEQLEKYVHFGSDTYECAGEYCVILNQVEEYYTVLATGERGTIAINSVFETMEEACYEVLRYMRDVKQDLSRYR
ncbi:MAG: hypothetical protein IKK75_02170 [Clostridia bacterium]|nr:hypothetical protein [Clostridia bacterium]